MTTVDDEDLFAEIEADAEEPGEYVKSSHCRIDCINAYPHVWEELHIVPQIERRESARPWDGADWNGHCVGAPLDAAIWAATKRRLQEPS